MTNTSTLLLFCSAALAIILTPGPNMIYIVVRSTSQGWKAGLISTVGVDSGTLIHVAAASLGLSTLLLSSTLAFNIIKYLGAAYLIYLGFRTWFSPTKMPSLADPEPVSLPRVYVQGMLTNVLNPKVGLFFLTFLPQFVDPSRGNIVGQMLFFGIIFACIGFVVDVGIALLAATSSACVRQGVKAQHVQKKLAGSVYMLLGVLTTFAGVTRT